MTILVTGSSGHLGEALVRLLRQGGEQPRGIDLRPSPFTDLTGSITDRSFVRAALDGVRGVLHTATLHKPHVVTHSHQQFVDTNVTGTLTLLEAAADAGVEAFVQTSTTSVFGDALHPPPGASAAWIDEDVAPLPKNIYGATKFAAEHLCRVIGRNRMMPVVVLRTSRFFPEESDDPEVRRELTPENLQALELLHRRGDIADMASAHVAAVARAKAIGFGVFVVSASTPFTRDDLAALRNDPAAVIRARFPESEALFAAKGWRLPSAIDRVYDNTRARAVLGWQPRYDFGHVLDCLAAGRDFRSDLALAVGAKGYHEEIFDEGPYPV